MIMEGWTNKLALRTDGPTSRVAVWVGATEGEGAGSFLGAKYTSQPQIPQLAPLPALPEC